MDVMNEAKAKNFMMPQGGVKFPSPSKMSENRLLNIRKIVRNVLASLTLTLKGTLYR